MAKIKDVLINDGQEANFGDINNLQRYARSQLFDAVLGSLAWNVDTAWSHATYPKIGLCYALRDGGMPYYPGGGVTGALNPGMLLVAQADAWGSSGTGDDANFWPMYIGSTSLTFGSNSSGNPRWDIVQIAITNPNSATESRHYKDAITNLFTSETGFSYRREMTGVPAVKAGTPAASPTEPTADAGYVKIAAYRLNNGFVSGGQPNDMRDYRIPLGMRVVQVPGNNWSYVTTDGWSLDASGPFSLQADGIGADSAYAMPMVGNHARLMKIGLTRTKAVGSTGAVSLVRMGITGIATSLLTLTSSLLSANGSIHEEYALDAETPIWANGYAAHDIQNNGSDLANNTHVALKFLSAATYQDVMRTAKFYFAGGL